MQRELGLPVRCAGLGLEAELWDSHHTDEGVLRIQIGLGASARPSKRLDGGEGAQTQVWTHPECPEPAKLVGAMGRPCLRRPWGGRC